MSFWTAIPYIVGVVLLSIAPMALTAPILGVVAVLTSTLRKLAGVLVSASITYVSAVALPATPIWAMLIPVGRVIASVPSWRGINGLLAISKIVRLLPPFCVLMA